MSGESFALSLLEASLVRPAVLVAGAIVLLRVCRVQHPASQHAVWTAVLIGMLLVPLISTTMPHMELPLLPAPPPQTSINEKRSAMAIEPSSAPAVPRTSTTTGTIVENEHSVAPAPKPPASAAGLRPAALLLWLYAAGVFAMAAYRAAGWLFLRRLLARSRPLSKRWLRESDDVVVPVAVGVLRPSVILPSDWRQWDAADRRAVMSHELAHIRRRDTRVSAFSRSVRCLLWFQPLAWWVSRRISESSEMACDVAAIETVGNPARYARLLLGLADKVIHAGHRAALPGLAIVGSSSLARRIDQVLATPNGKLRRLAKPAAVLALIGVPAVGIAATLGLTSVKNPSLAVPVPSASQRSLLAVPSLPVQTTQAPSDFSPLPPSPQTSPMRFEMTGRWRADGFPDTWLILLSNGSTVTGTVENPEGSTPIFAGEVDGNTIRFKTKNKEGDRTIIFAGTIASTVNGDVITFARTVEGRAGGDSGWAAIYGSLGPASFIASRVGVEEPTFFRSTVEDGGPMPLLVLNFIPTSASPGARPVAVPVQAIGFSARIAPGEYRVEIAPVRFEWVTIGRVNVKKLISGMADGFFLKSMTSGPTDLLKQPIVIRAAGMPPVAITIGVSSPPRWVKLSGRITGMENSPTKAATIAITLATNELSNPLIASLKPDGSFELPKVLPGMYQVELAPKADPFMRQITVTESASAVVEIPMRKSSQRVSGTLTGVPGGPNEIFSSRISGALVPTDSIGEQVNTGVLADGSFSFDSVPTGNYLLSFKSNMSNMSANFLCRDCDPLIPGYAFVSVSDRDVENLVVPFGRPLPGVVTVWSPGNTSAPLR